MSFAATHLVGFGAGGETAAGAGIVFCASAGDTGLVEPGGTYTFSSHGIGTASSDRYIIVVLTNAAGSSSTNFSSVTVAGTSCTRQVQTYTNEGGVSIWITNAAITSGTTATIVATVSSGGGNSANCGIGTFAVTGLASTVATATAQQTTNNTSTNLAVSAGGVAVAVAYQQGTSSFTTTGMTESFDSLVESTLNSTTGCCDNQSSTQTLSITINCTESTNFHAAYAAFL